MKRDWKRKWYIDLKDWNKMINRKPFWVKPEEYKIKIIWDMVEIQCLEDTIDSLEIGCGRILPDLKYKDFDYVSSEYVTKSWKIRLFVWYKDRKAHFIVNWKIVHSWEYYDLIMESLPSYSEVIIARVVKPNKRITFVVNGKEWKEDYFLIWNKFSRLSPDWKVYELGGVKQKGWTFEKIFLS